MPNEYIFFWYDFNIFVENTNFWMILEISANMPYQCFKKAKKIIIFFFCLIPRDFDEDLFIYTYLEINYATDEVIGKHFDISRIIVKIEMKFKVKKIGYLVSKSIIKSFEYK